MVSGRMRLHFRRPPDAPRRPVHRVPDRSLRRGAVSHTGQVLARRLMRADPDRNQCLDQDLEPVLPAVGGV